jgi:hypothetical protein
MSDDDWEYQQLTLPKGVSRKEAALQLAVHSEFSGWELARVLLFVDGTRRVWLKRRRPRISLGSGAPGLAV